MTRQQILENTMRALMSGKKKVTEAAEDEIKNKDDIMNDETPVDAPVEAPVENEAPAEEPVEENGFVGKYVVNCKLCGIPFFVDDANLEDAQCPSCLAGEMDLELVGKVCPVDGCDETEEAPAEETPADEVAPDEIDPEKALEDEDLGESCKKGKTKKGRKLHESRNFEFDEIAMKRLVEKFLRENYKNTRSYKVTEARITKAGKLAVKGIIEFKSGRKSKADFLSESFNLVESKSFKVKACCPLFTKSNAFVLESSFVNGKLAPKTLGYKYVTRTNEGKAFSVFGKSVL